MEGGPTRARTHPAGWRQLPSVNRTLHQSSARARSPAYWQRQLECESRMRGWSGERELRREGEAFPQITERPQITAHAWIMRVWPKKKKIENKLRQTSSCFCFVCLSESCVLFLCVCVCVIPLSDSFIFHITTQAHTVESNFYLNLNYLFF